MAEADYAANLVLGDLKRLRRIDLADAADRNALAVLAGAVLDDKRVRTGAAEVDAEAWEALVQHDPFLVAVRQTVAADFIVGELHD